MIYIITIGIFLLIISIAILACLLLKVHEQHSITAKRIDLLSQSNLSKEDIYMYHSLYEIYEKSYSHYRLYCVGHFSNILLDIYSIVLSIAALSMTAFGYTENLPQITSLLSTLFIVTLVFSRLGERSEIHFKEWKRCEKTISKISHLMSTYTDKKINKIKIDKLITSYCKKP